ncbi:MAG: HNH endonuclease signature motif containing protein [Candidatus Peregrinibacteria bacterium]|nr:HNH endonuclease signature motif containing protein [Candidatus Peregrinibacteria bacterium]
MSKFEIEKSVRSKVEHTCTNVSNEVDAKQSHKSLHMKFAALGRERNRLTYELLAILPQIYNESIYKEHKCGTIYEYAGRYAGLSHSVVEKTLKLHQNLNGKPFLYEAIRTAGVHKVALVAKIATAETDEMFAKRVKEMSMPALQELSKELRTKVKMDQSTLVLVEDDLFAEARVNNDTVDEVETNWSGTSYFGKCRATQEAMTISLDPEMQFLFLQLKKKYEKESGVNLSGKQALRLMLAELNSLGVGARGRKIDGNGVDDSVRLDKDGVRVVKKSGEKGEIRQKTSVVKNFCAEKIDEMGGVSRSNHIINFIRSRIKIIDKSFFDRYVPVSTQKEILAKSNGKCEYPGCNRPYENFHHRVRFKNGGTHDSIIPVCKIHHEYAHNGLIADELIKPEEWWLNFEGENEFLYTKFRKD